MLAIDNSGILNYCCNMGASFVGAATFAYNEGADTITVTDASTFTAPAAFAKAHVTVHDRFGGKKTGEIAVALGNVVVDVSTLNASHGFAVEFMVVSNQGTAKDGTAFRIANNQTTGSFDVEK